MNVQYQAPSEDYYECKFLRDNFINCLEEKSRKDEVTARKCNLHWLPYFSLECPKDMKEFRAKDSLRKLYIENKNAPYELAHQQFMQEIASTSYGTK